MPLKSEIDEDLGLETVENNPLYLGLIGAGVTMILTSLMTWAENDAALSEVAISGTDGRWGVLVMFLGALVTVLGFIGWAYNPWSDPEAGWALFFSVIGIVIAVVEMVRLQDRLIAPDVGAGLWLFLVASLIAAVLSAIVLFAPEP